MIKTVQCAIEGTTCHKVEAGPRHRELSAGRGGGFLALGMDKSRDEKELVNTASTGGRLDDYTLARRPVVRGGC